jgi:hypothetical protein
VFYHRPGCPLRAQVVSIRRQKRQPIYDSEVTVIQSAVLPTTRLVTKQRVNFAVQLFVTLVAISTDLIIGRCIPKLRRQTNRSFRQQQVFALYTHKRRGCCYMQFFFFTVLVAFCSIRAKLMCSDLEIHAAIMHRRKSVDATILHLMIV